MQASVNGDLCIGCGLCVEICPEAFALGDDMIARANDKAIPETSITMALEAAQSCPVEAITIE